MAVVKLTFDGSTVDALRDAEANYFLSGNVPSGVLRGLGGELDSSFENNYITFKSGYVQIYGRRVYVEEGTKLYVSLNRVQYGCVYLEVNIANNTAIILAKEAPTSQEATSLVKQDLFNGGNIYQFRLCTYYKTTSSLQITTKIQDYIYSHKEYCNLAIRDSEQKMLERYDPSYYNLTAHSGANSTKAELSDDAYYNINKALIVVQLSNGMCVTCPGTRLNYLSLTTFTFYVGNTSYTLGLETSNYVSTNQKRLYVSTNTTTIIPQKVYIYF